MDKERITITIRKDLLKKIDKSIDGLKLRNRSHAIESIIEKSLGPKIQKAIILAGGKGSQLRPDIHKLPKSMIPVHNEPIIAQLLKLLRNHDIKDIAVVTGYLGEKIEQYLEDGSRFGVNITYFRESSPQGTAGALLKAKSFIGNQKFLLLHGDIITTIDLNKMVGFSHKKKALAIMALTSVADPSVYGSVKLQGTQVVDFIEKPTDDLSVSRLVNAGIYILDPKVLDEIPQGKSYLETDVFPKLIKQKTLIGYPFDSPWFDISTPESYQRAIKEFSPE